MNKSDDIALLAAALSKLQGEVKDAYKDKQGYGYKYSDLSSVLDIVRPLIAKYRLSITQLPGAVGEKVSLETVLMHESGQWISSTMEMPVERGKGMSLAQATGAVMTYARRYALAAIIGIAQTDNDAYVEPDIAKDDLYKELVKLCEEKQISADTIDKWCAWAKVSMLKNCSVEQLQALIDKLKLKDV